jgi:hypothetical protein
VVLHLPVEPLDVSEEVVLLVVDEAEESLLAEDYLYLEEGLGLPTPEFCGWYGPLLATHSALRVWTLRWPP